MGALKLPQQPCIHSRRRTSGSSAGKPPWLRSGIELSSPAARRAVLDYHLTSPQKGSRCVQLNPSQGVLVTGFGYLPDLPPEGQQVRPVEPLSGRPCHRFWITT